MYLIIDVKDNCNCSFIRDISQNFTILADEINQLCTETLTTILLEGGFTACTSLMAKCGQQLNLTKRYKWGEVIPVEDYCNATQFWNSTLHPSVVVLRYTKIDDIFRLNIEQSKPFGKNPTKEPILIKLFGVSDTRLDKTLNTKRAVSLWEQVANERNYDFFIDQAFDGLSWSDKREISLSRNGWWYLVKDPGTTSTSEFIFQDKIKVASKIDNEENPKYLPWYRDVKFNKNSSGIVFQGQISIVSASIDFCRLLSFGELDDLAKVISYANKMITSCGESFQLYLLKNNLLLKDGSYLLELKDHITILIPVDTLILPKGCIRNYPENITELGFKFGNYIDIRHCGRYDGYSSRSKYIINDVLADTQSSIYVFHYEEYKDTVDLGARRMFYLRNVLFDVCRKLVLQHRNVSVDLGLAVKGIYKNNNFYGSPWAMKNYLKYINLMSHWAENNSNTVVFLGQDEDRNFDGDHRRSWATIGWYSYNDY